MLLELNIRNIALIERLRIDFQKGLNVLTGETGAGKSIVIDSVNLALGFLEIGRIGALVSFCNFSVAAMLLSIAVNWYIKRRLDRRADDEEPSA